MASASREEDRRHVASPLACLDDRRQHVQVRVANRVPGTAPLREDPEPDCQPDDEQGEQQEWPFEGHRTLAQTACTWTMARTPSSSASPRTRATTREPLTDWLPETLATRLALGGLRV